MRFTIKGDPRTKKNSMRIVVRGKKRFLLPSEAFLEYQEAAGYYIPYKWSVIDFPVCVKCVYYMKTHRKVDLVNLLEGTCDILKHYGVIKDDSADIVASHDGSRVLYDKENPRVEIEITEVEP